MDHLDLQLGVEFCPRYFPRSDALKFLPRDDFFAFPRRPGYDWNDQTGRLEDSHLDVNIFYQQWLYFGLLHTVLEGIPIQQQDFINGRYITTEKLGDYLSKWEQEAGKAENRKELTMRMIRAQLALDKARQIVSKLCDFDWDAWEVKKGDDWGPLRKDIDKKLVLSLLVLGETLTNAKGKIIERLGYTIQGWHGNANEGWGVSAAVVVAMGKAGWCKRTIYVLACQLRRHEQATALLAAKQAYREISTVEHNFHVLQGHDDCTKEECKFKSEDDQKEYKPRHRRDCPHSDNTNTDLECEMIGPAQDEVIKVIQDGKIPLMQYDASSSRIVVNSYQPGVIYTAMSHVWSDGHGNRNESKLYECQLKYLSKLIEGSRRHSNNSPLFWMDTLAIPRDGDARKKAVSRIDQVYRSASSTIVLDLGLDSMQPGTAYHYTALKVLASGWMRRLWTLQEAYLSHKISFAFDGQDLLEVDELEERYRHSTHHLTSNLASSARTYFSHIMGDEKLAQKSNATPENRYDLIASVWRSAQWRTIHRKTDEPIVLEALFELNRKRAKAARGLPNGKQNLAITRHEIDNPHKPSPKDRLRVAEMMKELWIELEVQSPGCIPSGLIFLPGERLRLEGFGWAPKSWMTGQEIDYPDPLSLPQSTSRLIREKGLSVRYPGFLLHCRDSQDVFWPNGHDDPYVHFPCDSTLDEWYKFQRADLSENTPIGMAIEKMRFAIILCRPKPRERQEVALLVDVVDEMHPGRHGSNVFTKVYKADIICRILIQRAIGVDRAEKLRQLMSTRDAQEGPGFICGEELSSDQEWIVDAYFDDKPPTSTSQAEPTPDDPKSQIMEPGPAVSPNETRTQSFRKSAKSSQQPPKGTSIKGKNGQANQKNPPITPVRRRNTEPVESNSAGPSRGDPQPNIRPLRRSGTGSTGLGRGQAPGRGRGV